MTSWSLIGEFVIVVTMMIVRSIIFIICGRTAEIFYHRNAIIVILPAGLLIAFFLQVVVPMRVCFKVVQRSSGLCLLLFS